MKKILISVFGAGLLLTSCSSDEPMIPGNGTEQQVTFTINVPEAMGTRAGEYVNSAKGGVTNGAGKLNYTVALYNQLTGDVVWSSTEPESTTATTATFTPTVVLGYEYKIVAYATFGDTAVEVSKFGEVATREVINDESEDAYFHNGTILGAPQMAATLKRPFGKLRLVAEDYDDIKALGLDVESVTVTYKNGVKNTFDALESLKFYGEGKAAYETGKTNYSDELNSNEYTVFADYLPADSSETEDFYSFDITVTYKDNKGQVTRTFSQDIPVKRNHLTTLRGNFFTTQAQLTLTVEEMFADETVVDVWDGMTSEPVYDEVTKTYTITNAGELAWIAYNNTEVEKIDNVNIVFANDINLQGLEWKPINLWNAEHRATIDGRGYKVTGLRITSAGSGSGLFGTLVGDIKNLTVEGVEIEKPSGSFTASVAGNLYGNLENVHVKDVKISLGTSVSIRCGAIVGIHNSGNATNCSVENAEVSAYHNVGGISGSVNETSNRLYEKCIVKNSKFTSYGNAPYTGAITGNANGVTLTLRACSQVNCEPTALVGMGINNVTTENVEVNGVYYENISDALAAGGEGATVNVLSGEYDFPTAIPNGATINGGDGVVIKVGGKTVSSDNVTIKGVTFQNDGTSKTPLSLSGKNSTLEDCIFLGAAGNGYGLVVIGNDADNVITLRNCDFSQDDFFKPVFDGWSGLDGGTLLIENSKLTNGFYAMHIDANGESGKVVVKNSLVGGFVTNGASLESISFENCIFEEAAGYACVNLYTSHSFVNCTFPTKADANNVNNYGLYVSSKAAGDAMAMKNCKMSDGTAITSAENAAVVNGGFLHWDSDAEACVWTIE